MIETRDVAEIQALLRHHAQAVVDAIDDGGIKPSKREELERTCVRLIELAKALGKCETVLPNFSRHRPQPMTEIARA